MKEQIREYWERHPNASIIGAGYTPGRREYFERIEQHRYSAEPCIREMAAFPLWAGRRIVEVGCGIGTDLRQFAKAGATVVGVDLTWEGVRLAKAAFEEFGLSGSFVVADAESLPFRNQVFDLAYSHGVIHHTPDTNTAVAEIHRILRSNGEARVMVYHRDSYFARFIVGVLLQWPIRILVRVFPSGRLPGWLVRLLPNGFVEIYKVIAETGFSREKLFALATDPSWSGTGNANPLSKCYSRVQAKHLFKRFNTCTTEVRQLYLTHFLPRPIHRWVERRWGWFLYVRAQK